MKNHIKNSRRNFIKAVAGASLLAPISAPLFATGVLNKRNFLVIPPLDRGVRKGKDVTFNLSIGTGKTEFFKGIKTNTLGINQSYLGPVLRASRGDTVKINVKNTINDLTTLHWHGMVLPAKMDGGPHQTILPGKVWNSTFQIRQDASTLWYHSHAMHQTGPQVYHGLAGMFIIDDEASLKADLPQEYGVDDIPCTIQDRRFNQDGSLAYKTMMPDRMMGMQGSTIMVNGVVAPTLKAQKTLMRLRLHNGSNARTYNLAFNDGRPFQLIATDGGFLEQPFQTNLVRLAAAERIEILVDVSDRKEIMLKSMPSKESSGMGGMPMMRMMNNSSELDILLIDARNATASTHKAPKQLPATPATISLDPRKAVATRKFELEMGMMGRGGGPMGMMRGMGGMMGGGENESGMFRINGKSMDMNRIDFQVKRNTTEIWEISNSSPMAHPFHVHNVQFRVLDRNGKRPHLSESGPKDVVLVHGGETVRIVLAFPEYSDPQTPYMYHCHILEHEDQGMMGQFVVV